MAKGKEREKLERALIFAWSALIVVGLLVAALSRMPGDPYQKMTFIGAGIGIVAAGVGFIGVWIAVKSDNKMRAIANLEFDEKCAIMQEYEAYFNQDFDEAKFELFRWDLEAMASVSRWADKYKRIQISQSIEKIFDAVNGKVSSVKLARIRV